MHACPEGQGRGVACFGLIHKIKSVGEGAANPLIYKGRQCKKRANRFNRPCRMLFVLIDGAYEPSIAQALQARQAEEA